MMSIDIQSDYLYVEIRICGMWTAAYAKECLDRVVHSLFNPCVSVHETSLFLYRIYYVGESLSLNYRLPDLDFAFVYLIF